MSTESGHQIQLTKSHHKCLLRSARHFVYILSTPPTHPPMWSFHVPAAATTTRYPSHHFIALTFFPPPCLRHPHRRSKTVATKNEKKKTKALTAMSNQDSPTFHWHYSDFDDSNFQIRGRTLFFAVVLFCVILFITLIYLYARWVCRLPPFSSRPRLLPDAPSGPPAPQGLDLNAISNLPIILHRASSANPNEGECAICLGIFQDGEKVKVLPDCNHRYHSECIDEWLRTQSSCPLCRASLRVDSPV
ncbi:unnamed protein product [Coffea canephora]|uniref:RING-type E3 ubiquitin transferase n=1 Tax=Coffea canephora TaxID=49390 RepID=A0A068V266_COFCA|nr:unnamed protein product [Coffea canephora]